jgi:AraC family transcriptional activator of tynA and feaB
MMEIASWSTVDVEPHRRFEYWNDLVAKAVCGVNVGQPSAHDFNATISTRRLYDAAFTSFHSPAHEIGRTSRDISRDSSDAYLLSLQLGGIAELRQGGRETVLKPGDLGVIDGGRPFSVALTGDVRRMVAILPRPMVHRYAPIRRNLDALLIDKTEPCVDLLREYVVRLANPAFSVDGAVAEVLGENLCALLGVVVGHRVGDLADAHPQRDLQLEALLAYMRRNCSDPDLSPRDAAAHLRVSVRTVHKLMERAERSFGEWLLDERLHRCVLMLQDPTQVRRKISDIAWTCGFDDLSHFNNVFRSRLDTRPSDLRREATQARTRSV